MGCLTELLDLKKKQRGMYISDLVTSKTSVKIDHPAQIVNFAKPCDSSNVLNKWSSK
jgi:hypothetical protein